jgi:eukaryotic-like serine/threonine-protein kinase
MPFPVDTQFGPYKIISLIGAGGMGEVYRARDTRLLRDVAIKVLPESFTKEPERLRRFEQEARAVAALNHPNIVSVYDIGTADGVHYIVSELLEGETLREAMPATGMGVRRAVELATQMANGLAAAHEQGIVHRDMKPENVFVTRDGRLKILDFGLAKLRRPEPVGETVDGVSGMHAQTEAGLVLGTVGYMSPEQVRGEAADARSDIFSFGSILYEMLTGQRAFKRNTSAETMTAILKEEPQEMALKTGTIPPGLERIVRHCVEKQASRRFHSAHDIAFDLESVSGFSGTASNAKAEAEKPATGRWLWFAAAALLFTAGGVGIGAWMYAAKPAELAKMNRNTFRRGTIWNARFMPDGNLLYAAGWNGEPSQLFIARAGSTESRPLDIKASDILAISKTGELALLLNQHLFEGFEFGGMMARVPEGGGSPREVEDQVEYADWSPDGTTLATIRRVQGKSRLEYPVGNMLYETPGWVSHARISPDGKLVAFIDHPQARDDGGRIAVIDADKKVKIISGNYVSAQGLAWTPDGKEVWYTATTSGSNRQIWATTLEAKVRLVYQGTGTLTLRDIGPTGRVLFTRDDWRSGIMAMAPGATVERELSWHDWSQARDLTDDGSILSFDETGEAGGELGGIYIRRTDGAPAVLLGNGTYPTLSPDGKWLLALQAQANGDRGLAKFPTGAGEVEKINTGDVAVHSAYFLPDEKHILFEGAAPGDHGLRLWMLDLAQGKAKPVSGEGVLFRYRGCISADGKRLAILDPERKAAVLTLEGGAIARIAGAVDGDEPISWMEDGKHILVGRPELPNRVYTIDLSTGERKLYKTFAMPDPTGLLDSAPPSFSKDLKSYVFSYTRITSDLYTAEGLR